MSGVSAGATATNSSAATALQLLLFEVAGKAFAVDLALVDRVIEASDAVRTPRRPPFVDGVVEDRGRYLAVFNLRRRFGLPEPPRSHAAIVLLRGLDVDPLIGLAVDRVLQVVTVATDAILTPPPRVFGIRADDYADPRAGAPGLHGHRAPDRLRRQVILHQRPETIVANLPDQRDLGTETLGPYRDVGCRSTRQQVHRAVNVGAPHQLSRRAHQDVPGDIADHKNLHGRMLSLSFHRFIVRALRRDHRVVRVASCERGG